MCCAFHRATGGLRAETKTNPPRRSEKVFSYFVMCYMWQKFQANTSFHLDVIGEAGYCPMWIVCSYSHINSFREESMSSVLCSCQSGSTCLLSCLVSNGHPLLSFTLQGSQSRVVLWLTSLQVMTMTAIMCVCVYRRVCLRVTRVSGAQSVRHHGAAT